MQSAYGDILERAASTAERAGRPHIVVNMVSSADGAISLDGLSGGLSGSADKEVFFYLRSIADVILVGASTAREENYGQPKLSDELRAERAARGQLPLPRIAVTTRSMRIDWSSRLFGTPDSPAGLPLVICPAGTPAELVHAGGRGSRSCSPPVRRGRFRCGAAGIGAAGESGSCCARAARRSTGSC